MSNSKKNGELFDLATKQGRRDWLDYLKTGLADWMTHEGKDPYDPSSVMEWRELVIISDIPLEPLADVVSEPAQLEIAAAKLQAAKFDKGFDRNKVIEFLTNRLPHDPNLVEDVNLHHKDFSKCWKYIQDKAREQAVDGCAFVDDDTVFEWALDYYYKDDAAEEAEKASREAEARAERENKLAEAKAKREAKGAAEPVKLGRMDVSGQMNLMSLLASTRTENPAPAEEAAEQAVLSGIIPVVADIPAGVTGTAVLETAAGVTFDETADDFAIPDDEEA